MQPDIVFIITDQQRYDTVGAFGFSYVDTPHLDSLCDGGTWFSGCYVTGASCVPSRASLFNGVYPHTIGALDNASTWRHSWAERLAAAGYRCASIGKMHTQPMDAAAGFHERTVVENKDRSQARRGRDFVDALDAEIAQAGYRKPGFPTYRQMPDYAQRLGAYDYPLPEELHADSFVGRRAAEWIARNARHPGPLFLQVGFPGPHPPYDPPAHWAARYLDRDLQVRPVSQQDLDAQPPPFKALRERHTQGNHDAVAHIVNAPHAARHWQRAHYLGNVSLIDAQVGALIASLRASGRLENTVIVFTSDHGDCLGDHGHSQKWNFYEQSVRVPMIVHAPKLFSGRGEVRSLVQSIDVVPVLLELAGAEVPAWFESKTVLPALRGEAFEGRPAVYAEQGRDGVYQFTDFVSMVRTDRWKLVHFLGEPYGQLFDLWADPHEEQDRWHDPAREKDREALLRNLYEWRMQSAYHTRDWIDSFR